MSDKPLPTDDAQKVWRYMSFSRFVWLLQHKQLWLSRADKLGDPWEIALAGDQLAHVVSRHPISPLPLSGKSTETAIQRSKRITEMWRQTTFVNCWSASHHESHALWRVYCGATEGVAIQTTLSRLRASVGGLPVFPVTYDIPGIKRQTPTRIDLVTKKRPMFAYEQEVRIVLTSDEEAANELLGQCVDWNPEKTVEFVWVHPDADRSFMDTVSAVVAHYTPELNERVEWSAMKEEPPLHG